MPREGCVQCSGVSLISQVHTQKSKPWIHLTKNPHFIYMYQTKTMVCIKHIKQKIINYLIINYHIFVFFCFPLLLLCSIHPKLLIIILEMENPNKCSISKQKLHTQKNNLKLLHVNIFQQPNILGFFKSFF